MRVYVKSVGTSNVTLVDIDTGEGITLPLTTFEKLFRAKPAEGDVHLVQVQRLDDVAEMFRRWQEVVSQA